MYMEKFCKYKNCKIIINQYNYTCVCASCTDKKCYDREQLYICPELSILNTDDGYKQAKDGICELCKNFYNIKQQQKQRNLRNTRMR